MRAFLRGLREGAGLTQQALADALGVSRYTVNQLENGKRSLTPDMALRYSTAFGAWRVPAVELVEAWAREELERATFGFPWRSVRRVES